MVYNIGANLNLFTVQEVCPLSLGICFTNGKTHTDYIKHLINASDPIPKVVTVTGQTL